MWYAILLAAIALAYWAVRELVLNTFRNVSRKKPYIICFALAGFTIAVGSIVAGILLHPAWGILIPQRNHGLLQLILCPPALLGLAFMDIPHPPLRSTIILGLLIAVMNAALYAAIGARIGAAATKSKTLGPD